MITTSGRTLYWVVSIPGHVRLVAPHYTDEHYTDEHYNDSNDWDCKLGSPSTFLERNIKANHYLVYDPK